MSSTCCIFLLSVSTLLHRGHSQNIHQLLQGFLPHDDPHFPSDYQDIQNDYYGPEDDLNDVQETVRNLWMETFDNVRNSSILTAECVESVEDVFAHPSKLLPIVDASGKPGAGILSGNTIMAAAFDECFSYNHTGYCLANNVYLHKIYSIPWKIGLCVPKYCTNTDIAFLINATGELWVNESTVMCSNSKTPGYSPGAIVMITISFVFAALVLVATVIDAVATELSKLSCKRKRTRSELTETITEKTHLMVSMKNSHLITSHKNPSSSSTSKDSEVSVLDFIKAFSLFQTVPMLLATGQGASVITSLNGLRVISMFWVILGHVYVFSSIVGGVDNAPKILSIVSRFSFQAVGNAYFSVDSFFFLSGVLVAYLTLREMNKKKGHFPFLHYYIHRYLRLTPTYAFVLFFAMYLGRYLSVGPFMTLMDPFRAPCSKYWWTNLIYINNLYPWKLGDECMGWSWYLANDMQFYIIAPLMLITAYHYLPVGAVIAAAFICSGFTIDIILTGIFDFQANQLSALAYGYTSRPNSTQAYGDAIYTKPWDRISPYIVGLALGYILYRKLKFDYNKILNVVFHNVLWLVAAFTAFWLVYGLYFTWHGHIPHTVENVIYIMLGRFLWACCLALVVFACHNGYGWVVNSFLSMKLWIPLARMTFNAYLVHPLVIFAIFGQVQTSIHYTEITYATYVIASVVISYAAAAVVCVSVEFPLGSVEMLVFKLFGLGKRDSQRQDATKETKKDTNEA